LTYRPDRLACILVALSLTACATPQQSPEPETDRPIASAPGAAEPHRQAGTPRSVHVKKTPFKLPPARHPAVAATNEAEAEAAIADLLARMRSGFALPAVDKPAVHKQAAWFANNPAYLERALERARPYLAHVTDQVENRGLPAELVLVPFIESAFDPFAYSHGRAAGLWQIIPGTGERFGLKQNWWYDGRRDVVESTRAALDYLEYLNQLFHGDWLLTLAAYNSGEGTVGRAIHANRVAGQPTDFWHLRLPAETRAYVPRLLGLAAVLAEPDKHSVSLPEIPDIPVFATVDLDSQIDLAVAASLAGIELAELQALNPGFNRWATDPDGPHRLQLPVSAAEPFTLALADLPPAERVRWHRHEVRPGDTLGAIARKYRTTVDVVRSVNDLSGTTIRVGSHLLVPTSTRGTEAYPLSAGNRLAGVQERERSGRVRREHTVRGGESLWSIARKYGVGVRELAAGNGMAPGDTLAVGRKLVVWQRAEGAQATSPAIIVAAAGVAPSTAPLVRRVNYTVRRGDSLYRIADNFRVSVDDIRRWNQLDAKRHLQPGQRLVLHVDVTTQSGR
jgi:membrane-bound lytic murein transglycosylase D